MLCKSLNTNKNFNGQEWGIRRGGHFEKIHGKDQGSSPATTIAGGHILEVIIECGRM